MSRGVVVSIGIRRTGGGAIVGVIMGGVGGARIVIVGLMCRVVVIVGGGFVGFLCLVFIGFEWDLFILTEDDGVCLCI